MSKERADFFDEVDDIDVSDFLPKPVKPPRAAPAAEQVRKVATAAKFQSREPAIDAAPPPVARLRSTVPHPRTGRNVQFNLKADLDTINRFYTIANQQQCVLGETLARAVAALERELKAKP